MITKINQSYISDQVQRTLRIVKVLAGHEITGMSPTLIAEQVETTKSNVTRAIANLELIQWVERVPGNDEKFRLSAGMVQIANTVAANFHQALLQLQQDQHNYNRLAV